MILTFVEHDRGTVNELSFEALTFGRRLAERVGAEHRAVLIGDAGRPLADGLAAYGVATAHLAVDDRLDDYAPAAWGRSVAGLLRTLRPAVVVAAASDRGSEVLAHAAAMLDAPLAANVTEIADASADPAAPWTLIRQRWGGSLLEEARLDAPVKLLTLAPHAVRAEPAPEPGPVALETFAPEFDDGDLAVRVTDRVPASSGKVSLAEAKVVVGGGRGVGGPEGFVALEELAGLLGGAVGCSRVVTSNGWRPHSDQIGQTGTRIAPALYIACGISGATQHIVGCRAAKRILVINTDPEAPILSHADHAIIGDVRTVVPAITAEIRKVLAATGG